MERPINAVEKFAWARWFLRLVQVRFWDGEKCSGVEVLYFLARSGLLI